MKMKTKQILTSIISIFLFTTLVSCETQSVKNTTVPETNSNVCVTEIDFENTDVGQIPAGWKIENTNPKGELPTWKVIEDQFAASGKKVLALTDTKKSSGNSYNLCWTGNTSFTDGEVEVELKAVKGKEDQGGGVIWRALDKNNYYIARFNPLEDNFRIYYVKDGKRKQIKSADAKFPPGKWVKLKVVQRGNTFECYLNNKKLIEGTDDTFTKPGGVGLWTKADAATSFDNFTVIPYEKSKK